MNVDFFHDSIQRHRIERLTEVEDASTASTFSIYSVVSLFVYFVYGEALAALRLHCILKSQLRCAILIYALVFQIFNELLFYKTFSL